MNWNSHVLSGRRSDLGDLLKRPRHNATPHTVKVYASYQALHTKLEANGTIALADGHGRLTRDAVFTSSSTAGAIALGRRRRRRRAPDRHRAGGTADWPRHRTGQTKPVTLQRLIARATHNERMPGVLATKQQVQDDLIEAVSDDATFEAAYWPSS